MQRIAALVLVAAATCLLCLAGLLRVLVYPRTAVLPVDPDLSYTLATTSGSYLDTTTGRHFSGVPIQASVTIRGDVTAAVNGVVVWTGQELTQGGNVRFNFIERRVALNQRTALAVNCCGQYINTDNTVQQVGVAYAFPARVAARSYPSYDAVTRTVAPMRFQNVEFSNGLRVYRFVQRVGPVNDGALPGGLAVRAAYRQGRHRIPALKVPATRYTAINRTILVEPVSGRIIFIEDNQRNTIGANDGSVSQETYHADLKMTVTDSATQAAMAQQLKGRYSRLLTTYPIALLIGGALLLLLAPLTGRLRFTPRDGAARAPDSRSGFPEGPER